MHWDWQSRVVNLSVGDLSRFSLMPATDDGPGHWRMEIGSHWHHVLQDRARQSDENWVTEQAVEGSLSQNGWRFQVRGRIDLFKHGEIPRIREIKTTSRDLPMDEADLRELYPHYFHQAMLYGFLVGRNGQFPHVELLFLEIQTGITQTIRLNDADLDRLHQHLNTVISLLEERHLHFSRLRSSTVPQPFETWRPGQLECRDSLHKAMLQARVNLLEAPTGFGKTGIALEQALSRLVAGDVDRIVLLTGKNTGHAALVTQMERFREMGQDLTIQAMRSRRDLTLDSATEQFIPANEIADNWKRSGLSAARLLREGIVDLEYTKLLGERHGIPPWALARILMPHADIWIADFNYLFDPGVAQVFANMPTFDPSRTLLVIDEAHNLPERVAASHSHALEASAISRFLSEIQLARFSSPLARMLDGLVSFIRKCRPADCLDPPQEIELIEILQAIHRSIRDSGLAEDELSQECLEWLWNIHSLLDDWEHPDLPMLVSCPQKGTILFSCIDAAAVIRPILDQYFQTVMMSATLQPWDAFLEQVGMVQGGIMVTDTFRQDEAACIIGEAPWLEGCFEVLVDARVDTRYRQRQGYFALTAQTIAETSVSFGGCTIVFFPSYRYAESVRELLEFKHPGIRVAIQPKDLALEQQNMFLESSLMFQDVILLVLGSRFSEGIDSLGGRMRTAIVVSPALPEVNSLQREKEARVPGGKAVAFRKTYLIPGMRKISQALGRLVRNPQHSARILLHGKRFMEPEYQDLLPSYLQPVDFLITNEDFNEKWLKSGFTSF